MNEWRIIMNSQNLSGDKGNFVMVLRKLAESIILQAIEDLWNNKKNECRSSFAFFLGKGFHICSDLAGITAVDRRTLFSLIIEAVKYRNVPVAIPESQSVDREDVVPY
jgi:hypothetical protein